MARAQDAAAIGRLEQARVRLGDLRDFGQTYGAAAALALLVV